VAQYRRGPDLAAGIRGTGVVVGIVDGGITAVGRPVKPGEAGTAKVGRVIGGWPTADWGTTAAAWGNHGNMTSTDTLGMAPDAQIYDLRISDGNAISNALAGFQWAIDQHKANGTPQILSNSWGIFQESWDPQYATDPNHPFTRKVVDAVNEGILVLFAAGNCGATCPDGRCGPDVGPGRDIWGANGHPLVMTVGAVNKNEQFVGYSSQGPAALDPRKPDFCSLTHFQGYFASDSGTSAATPIAAGVVALLKQSSPAATQDQIKQALRDTAKDIGAAGWDQHSGAGIIRGRAAFDRIAGAPRTSGPVVAWGANRLDAFVIGTDRALYHKWWNGAAWGPSVTGYEGQGGVCASPPEVVAWAPNRLDVFVLGTDRAVYHKWWNGSAWGPSLTGYESLGGVCASPPKVVSWGPNRLDLFVIGTDSALYHKWWNGSAWGPSLSGWESLGGVCASPPEAVAWGPNRLDVFVLGTDRAVYHKWWNGSAWGPSVTGYEYMGGVCFSTPRVASWGPSRLDLFVLGGDSALYHKWWNGSAWGPSVTGYEYMGGVCVGRPDVVSWGPNRLDAFVIGTDSALYHKWWNGSAWGPSLTGYEYMGGVCQGSPRVAAWGPNRLDLFVIGTDSGLYHKWWNGSAWGPSVTGYEGMAGVVWILMFARSPAPAFPVPGSWLDLPPPPVYPPDARPGTRPASVGAGDVAHQKIVGPVVPRLIGHLAAARLGRDQLVAPPAAGRSAPGPPRARGRLGDPGLSATSAAMANTDPAQQLDPLGDQVHQLGLFPVMLVEQEVELVEGAAAPPANGVCHVAQRHESARSGSMLDAARHTSSAKPIGSRAMVPNSGSPWRADRPWPGSWRGPPCECRRSVGPYALECVGTGKLRYYTVRPESREPRHSAGG
jgi:hypothetical protein